MSSCSHILMECDTTVKHWGFKGCEAIKRSSEEALQTSPTYFICLSHGSWCYLEKTDSTLLFPTCSLFFSVKKPPIRRVGIFPLIKHLFWWFQCRAFVFYKKHLGDLSMITFLSRCSLYSCDIFLPTFCQYLGLKSCILTHRIQLCNPTPHLSDL